MKRLIFLIIAIVEIFSVLAAPPKIGLALGGGGAKGAAEVGVLKVLEEAGIHVDYIAGTSIGSIVGGLYASGYSAKELKTMFQTQEWISLLTDRKSSLTNEPYKTVDGVTYVFGFPVYDRNQGGFGMMRGEKIEQVLDSMVSVRGCTTFDKLRIPLRCVTADIRTAKEVVISDGRLCKAMRASMSIPGIYKPVERGNYMLVDGGMLNNLPVDVCRAMGADIVIAVDLQQSEQLPRKKTDISALSGIAGLFGFGGILEWITNRPDIQKYQENCKQADIYIHPNLPDADASSFGNKNAVRMISAGEEAARKQWNALLKLKANKLL
jgi:NTE family protein